MLLWACIWCRFCCVYFSLSSSLYPRLFSINTYTHTATAKHLLIHTLCPNTHTRTQSHAQTLGCVCVWGYTQRHQQTHKLVRDALTRQEQKHKRKCLSKSVANAIRWVVHFPFVSLPLTRPLSLTHSFISFSLFCSFSFVTGSMRRSNRKWLRWDFSRCTRSSSLRFICVVCWSIAKMRDAFSGRNEIRKKKKKNYTHRSSLLLTAIE